MPGPLKHTSFPLAQAVVPVTLTQPVDHCGDLAAVAAIQPLEVSPVTAAPLRLAAQVPDVAGPLGLISAGRVISHASLSHLMARRGACGWGRTALAAPLDR